MNTFMRKLFWILVLAVFVGGVSFLCLCFVPLEDGKEDAANMMLWEGGKHDDHIQVGLDDPCCRGCHPFIWRFNSRINKGEEVLDQAKEDAEKERIRQENIKKNEKKRRK